MTSIDQTSDAIKTPADEFDVTHQVDTSGKIFLDDLTIVSGEKQTGAPYQATQPDRFHAAMQYLSSVMDDDIKDYTFIDLGCGKGRALLLAAQMGFRSIIGVEFASELAEVARSNLRTANVSNAFVWEGDAGEFRFPRGKLLIYMYCPFYEPVMSRMIENLRASHQGGNFYVVYMRPLLRQVFNDCDFMSALGGPEDAEGIEIWKGAC